MENNSIRGRFSLSTTNLSNPIAESTCLNGTSTNTKFKWGEGVIGARSRNSSLASDKKSTLTKNLNGTPPKVSMTPKPRIDPRTYVDIRSNGLASRIVDYHDNSSRLNRSLSMGNLYSKPGQFPVVHLKKNEQQHRVKKNKNLSMTKIAAPEKSVYHVNALPAILRSTSLIGLQKSDEEISRENRPILHPPPTENDLAPTRSVLEVLKEISRKRINSDELDGTELIKKHCKESELDMPSYGSPKTQSKRQRETSSPNSTGLQLSPEQQVVKKRLCNYNNDILSSLSSSMLSANKKKMLEMSAQKRTVLNVPTATRSVPPDFESERNHSSSYILQPMTVSPITPLPSTPQVALRAEEDQRKQEVNDPLIRRASEPVISSTKPKLTLFNKNYDEAPTNVRNDIPDLQEDDGLSGIQFVKPKKSSAISANGALLLEKTKKSKLAIMLSGLKGELNEEDDEVDAPPPKQDNNTLDTPISSSLIKPASSAPTTQAAISFKTITTSATTLTSVPNTTNKSTAGLTLSPTSTIKEASGTLPSVSSSTSGSFKLTTKPAAPKPSSPAAAITTTSVAAIATTTPALTTSTIPTLSGFSFGLNKPTTTTTNSALAAPQLIKSITTSAPNSVQPAVVTSSNTTSPKSFSFGLPTTTVQAQTTAAPTFTFGSPNTPSLSTSKSQTQSTIPTFGSLVNTAPQKTDVTIVTTQSTFNFGGFGANNQKTTTTVPPLTSTPLQVAVSTNAAVQPTFSFGPPKDTWNPQANSAALATTNAPTLNTFGSIPSSNPAPPATTILTSATSSGGFSFNSTPSAKPVFNNTPMTITSSNSNSTFSFSASKPSTMQATDVNTMKMPSFGSPIATSVPSTTNSMSTPVFGNVNPVKPSNSFTFGASTNPTPAPAPFGFAATTDKPSAPVTTTGNSIGGFSFNATPSDTNKNVFGIQAPVAANPTPANPGKPVFAFGSTTNNQTTNEAPSMFGSSKQKSTNIFGAPATTTHQSSPFTFGSSNTSAYQGNTATNLFGATSSSTDSVNGSSSNAAASMFSLPAATVAPLQQSTSFTFGTPSNNTKSEPVKPTGAFVFGSSSAIGSNASKPSTEINKTFVFGDGSSTTITPSPAGTTNPFAQNNTTNSGNGVGTDNKIFSFGSSNSAPTAVANNNAFGSPAINRATNQSPVFSFGAATPSDQIPAQNGNMFAAPQAPGAQASSVFRPMRKAMRRLHKT